MYYEVFFLNLHSIGLSHIENSLLASSSLEWAQGFIFYNFLNIFETLSFDPALSTMQERDECNFIDVVTILVLYYFGWSAK